MSNCASVEIVRGKMVQQGCVPIMCDIAKCDNKIASELAAQTLAKITISTDPRKFREGAHYDMVCRGTWDPPVPCPFCRNLSRLSPQNLCIIFRQL